MSILPLIRHYHSSRGYVLRLRLAAASPHEELRARVAAGRQRAPAPLPD